MHHPAIGRTASVASWICQLAAAGILAQTLYFKLTYAPETQVIFGQIGGRPAATIVALMELACVVLLLVPRTAAWGALLSLAVIAGAIGTHLFVIGIEVVDPATGRGDGGLLFGLALAVALLATVVAVVRRNAVLSLLPRVRELLRGLPHAVPLALVFAACLAPAAHAVEPVNQDRHGLALKGYDTVAYFTQGRAVKGDAAHSYEWNGATWRFASAEHRELFAADPTRYAPQYGGYCAKAVSEDHTADADPEAWRVVDGKLYVNYSPKVQALWEQDIPGRIARADVNWPKLLAR